MKGKRKKKSRENRKMEKLEEYVFYGIFNVENKKQHKSIQYGVKRKNGMDAHDTYFSYFINMEPALYYDMKLTRDWNDSLCNIAATGNMIFANSAIEIENVKNRFYLLYLPSNPKEFQLQDLEHFLVQLQEINFDVGVYGKEKEQFLTIRQKKNFNSFSFVVDYIKNHREKLNQYPKNKHVLIKTKNDKEK